MIYRIDLSCELDRELRRIVDEQAGKAVKSLDVTRDKVDEGIHSFRKHCKKIRAVLRLARPSSGDLYNKENAVVRDAAEELAVFRDTKVVCDTLKKLRKETSDHRPESIRWDRLQSRFEVQEEARLAQVNMSACLSRSIDALTGVRKRTDNWEFGATASDIADGLKRTYKCAHSRFEAAYETRDSAALHECRKRIKYHWYHCRLLRGVWKPAMKVRAQEAKSIANFLGLDHDLAMLGDRLDFHRESLFHGDSATFNELAILIERWRHRLQDEAHPVAATLLSENPSSLANRLQGYWVSAQNQK